MTGSLVKSLQLAAPYTDASPDYTPALGTNLEGVSYYSTALPFLDLMKSSSGFFAQSGAIFDTGDQLNLDANGYVTSIPGNVDYDRVGIILLDDNAAAPPDTDYVVLYQGQGNIQGMLGTTVVSSQPGELVVQSAADGSLELQITATDPNNNGDYIQNIHVVQESLLPLYQAGLTFNPAFLVDVENFNTIRFMNWTDANEVFDQNGHPIAYSSTVGPANIEAAPQISWSEAPTINQATWTEGGVPVEALVEAANLTGTNLWVNMPINASDEYIQQFADYVKANLDPGLKVYVELSNEVWNFAFPQAYYAQAQAQAMFGNVNGGWFEWYGVRAAQMGIIWKDVFGEPETGTNPNGQVQVVFSTQLENKGLEQYGLNTPDWVDANGNHIVAANYFNDYAVTGYYGGFLSNDSEVPTVQGWMSLPDGGLASAIAALSSSIVSYNTPLYDYAAAQAQAYGLQLVSYESGFGAQNPPSEAKSSAYTAFLENLQNDPAIYSIEQQNIAAFEAAGGTLYNNYDAIAAPSSFGSWGALESVTETTSPRYQALTDWNAAHPDSVIDPTTYQNARIYQAGNNGETIAGTLHGYDVLIGGAGDDTFVPYGTGAVMDGEGGFNAVLLPGALANYAIADQSDGSIIVRGYGETFTLINIQELEGNDGATLSTGTPILAPKVTSVTASGSGITAGAGTLGVGAEVTLTVDLSGYLTVSGGVPTLALNDGGIATYTGGSGSMALTFSYTVVAGQDTTDLAVTGFNLNGATLVAGYPTIAGGSGQSLTDANGHVFSFGARYSGADYNILRDGLPDGAGASLTLIKGTVWDHTSSYGWYADNSGDWLYQATAPSTGVANVDLSGGLTAASLTGVVQVATPAPAPEVTSVVASGSGITAGSGDLGVGAVVTLTVNLSAAVNVSGGTPTLVLNDGGVASYVSGSGSSALVFSYTVAAGQDTVDLAVTAVDLDGATVGTGVPTVAAGSGQSLTDANGHVFSFGNSYNGIDHTILRDGLPDGAGIALALVNGTVWDDTSSYGWYSDGAGSWVYQTSAPSLGGVAAALSGAVTNPAGVLQIDTTTPATPTGPTVTSVVASGSGITAGAGDLGVGAVVTLTVNLSAAVNVSGGTPTLVLNDGGVASYVSGSGSSALVFSYTVAAGQDTADLAVTAVDLDGATVGTGVPTVAAGGGQSLTDANGHVFSFGNSYNGIDHTILRDGLPDGAGIALALVNGTVWDDTSSYGWYSDGAGSWVYQTSAPSLGGVAAALSGAVTNPAGVLQIDTTTPATPTGPTVTSVVASGSGITAGAGDLGVGAVVTLTVDLSEAVVVSGGAPTLILNDGGVATYTSGSGSAALNFSYTVATGQNTAELEVTAIDLNGASVATGIPTVAAGSDQSLTDADGHVFSFGGSYTETDHYILRDGLPDGAGVTLALVNGTVWDHTSSYGWYSDNAGTWVYQPTAPPVVAHEADLSGAVANPTGILQIDTTPLQTISGETLDGASVTAATLANSGVIDVTGGLASTLTNVSINGATKAETTIDAGSTLDLGNTTISGASLSNVGTVDATSGISVLNAVAVTNSGTIEATTGALTIASGSLINNGDLLANGGTLTVAEAVTGSGAATIAGSNSVLEFGAAMAQTATFSAGAVGVLKLDVASGFAGIVAGFTSSDAISLQNFQFSDSPTIISVTGTGAIGTTTDVAVKDGAQSTTLHLLNQTLNEFPQDPAFYVLKEDNSNLHHGTLFELHP